MTDSDQSRRIEFQFEKFKIGSKWHNFNFGQQTQKSFLRVLQFWIAADIKKNLKLNQTKNEENNSTETEYR